MKKRNVLTLLGVLVFGTMMMSAQASRTWVSGVGDDANPCSRTAPCKTFAGAISKTAPGGEIDALDPAGFGAVTITKAITIDGGGGQVASVLVAGTNGIVVAASGSDVVILRNLRITTSLPLAATTMPLVPATKTEATWPPPPSMVMALVMVTAPNPAGSRASISPPGAVLEMAPAKVLQGAVRLQGLASSPTPDTQVREAWALIIMVPNTRTPNKVST